MSSYVQSAGRSGSGTFASFFRSYGAQPTIGNLLIATAFTNAAVSSVTDNMGGNTWILPPGAQFGSPYTMSMAYAVCTQNSPGAPANWRVTFNFATTATNPEIIVMEYVPPSGFSLDTAFAFGANTFCGCTLSISYTTHSANELAVIAAGCAVNCINPNIVGTGSANRTSDTIFAGGDVLDTGSAGLKGAVAQVQLICGCGAGTGIVGVLSFAPGAPTFDIAGPAAGDQAIRRIPATPLVDELLPQKVARSFFFGEELRGIWRPRSRVEQDALIPAMAKVTLTAEPSPAAIARAPITIADALPGRRSSAALVEEPRLAPAPRPAAPQENLPPVRFVAIPLPAIAWQGPYVVPQILRWHSPDDLPPILLLPPVILIPICLHVTDEQVTALAVTEVTALQVSLQDETALLLAATDLLTPGIILADVAALTLTCTDEAC